METNAVPVFFVYYHIQRPEHCQDTQSRPTGHYIIELTSAAHFNAEAEKVSLSHIPSHTPPYINIVLQNRTDDLRKKHGARRRTPCN